MIFMPWGFVPLYVNASQEALTARLIINGAEVLDLPVPPMIVDGRALVPFREVFERVGGTVGWHSGNMQVSLFFGTDVLVMTIGERDANFNGEVIQMHAAPIIHEGRTMVPLRFPAEIFGFDVSWDTASFSAIVNTNNDNSTDGADDTTGANNTNTSNNSELPPPGERPGTGSNITSTAQARDVSAFPIQTIQHTQATITRLLTPMDTGIAAYVVVADSAITGVSHFLLYDNRLVVDIHNSASLISGDFYAPANLPVTGVRASQFSQTPRVTRVVFDVVGDAEFSISLSADRTLLTVQFSQNRIHGVFTQSDASSDTLFIMGDILPAIRICTQGFPKYITLSINNAFMDAEGGMFSEGIFAREFITGQNDDGSAYVRVYVGETWPAFSTAQSANAMAFMMHHGIEGVRYDSVNRELRISRAFDMDISQVQQINDYLRLQYTFVLPLSAEVLGRGEISVLDGFVNSISLARNATGEINLTFSTTRVLAFSIYEEGAYYVIRVNLPRDVSPFIVVLDPGHGGSDPGTSHNSVTEKDLVLDVAHMVLQLLSLDPFVTVYMTRHTDTFLSPWDRAEFANNLDADMFVSIHANAAQIRPGEINPEPHGIETLYTIGILEYEAQHNINSRQLAEIFQSNLVEATGAHSRGLVPSPQVIVVRETSMPAVLLELGFLTNPEEAALLATVSYQWQLAHAIHQSIMEAFAEFPPTR